MAPETVLVINEDRSAQAAKSALVSCSYRVLTAATGEQALQILEAQAPVHLALSELVLPEGMSGIALVGRIRLGFPSTSIVLMAGADHQPLDPGIPLLEKPFTASALIERVREVLAESRRNSERLARTFAAIRTELDELSSAAHSIGESGWESREKRSERFCARLRAAGKAATILVAEDDPALRYSVARYLTHRGFRVLEAEDGREALDISRKHAGHIDMLVTDYRMPGLNGVELADTVAAERPRTEIILMTADDIELPRRGLRKPFDLDDLLADIVGALLRA